MVQLSEDTLLPTFGDAFLTQHAGSIITDVRHAVVEIVANSWDAGASQVRIAWPEKPGDTVVFEDDGTGMSQADFVRRWNELSYNRLQDQGKYAEFPSGHGRRVRLAFGRNGVGRHAMFYFNEEYTVETAKDGLLTRIKVEKSFGRAPFTLMILGHEQDTKHGTRLSAVTRRDLPHADEIAELLGSRFVADPEFRIVVNDVEVKLTDLDHLSVVGTVLVPNLGEFTVHRFDSEIAGRTSQQNGVAWWVQRRLVGTPSWDVFDGPLLDARTQSGKRYVYVVEAHPLGPADVKADWSGFHANSRTNAARQAISEYVRQDLRDVMRDVRRERKLQALQANRRALQNLPVISQEHVARFTEDILDRSPTITPRDLDNAVEVLAKLEQSRSRYDLLGKLAKLESLELDVLDDILDQWTVRDAKRVLDELRYRLELISRLEQLVDRQTTDELHDLQPLFESGLWIFGPKFETLSFTSNRTLSTVVRTFLGDAVVAHPRFRPDFVVLPDSSIGFYSSDAFDDDNEVCGLDKVVIVELKRGGFLLTEKEKDQAMQYARELRRTGRLARQTEVVAYVLGSTINPVDAEDYTDGQIVIKPRRYSDVLRQAHARTFNLLEKMKQHSGIGTMDRDLQSVVSPAQAELDLL